MIKCPVSGADSFWHQYHSLMVSLVNNNIYCVHTDKNRAIERLHSFNKTKKKITIVYKKQVNWCKEFTNLKVKA